MGAEIRHYIESLSSSKEEERADKANLQVANEKMLLMQSELQGQLATKDEQMKALIEQVSQLTSNVVALTKKVTSDNYSGGAERKRTRVRFNDDKENSDPNAKAAAGKDTRPPWLIKMSNMGGYCWSCGYNPVRKSHTSATCKRKAPGHKDDATATDQKGGSAANKPE